MCQSLSKLKNASKKILFTATIITSLCFSTSALAAEYSLKVAYENNPGEPFDLAVREWARLFHEKTEGKGELIPFPSSQLGSKKDVIEQMALGSPVITLADGAFFSDYIPDFGIVFGPYLADSYQGIYKLMASDWFKGLEKDLDKKAGLTIVTKNWLYGTRHMVTNKPVYTPDDLVGLKIRVPNNKIQIEGLAVLGATPTPMPLAEVYTSLNLKVIDGAENPISVLYGQKHHEVAKYLILTGHVENITNLIMGSSTFKRLPADIQAALIESGDEAGDFLTNLTLQEEQNYIEKMKAEGVTVIEVDRSLFKEKAIPFYNKFPRWSNGLYDKTQSIINE